MSSPSQRQRAEAARMSTATPQRSLNKRLADIQAALGQEPQAPSVTRHCNSQPDAAVTNGHQRSFLFGDGSQSSQASTIADLDDSLSVDELSGGELSSQSASPDHSGLGSFEWRTPKKRRITPAEPSSGVQNLPPTPPQTVHRHGGPTSGQETFPTDFPSTPTKFKGKGRAYPRLDKLLQDQVGDRSR